MLNSSTQMLENHEEESEPAAPVVPESVAPNPEENLENDSDSSSDNLDIDLDGTPKEELRKYFLKTTNEEAADTIVEHEQEESQKTESVESDDDEGDWNIVPLAGEKPLFPPKAEITMDRFLSRYKEVDSRGKKLTNPTLYLKQLHELYEICKEKDFGPGVLTKIHLSLITTLLDASSALNNSTDYQIWFKTLELMNLLFELLAQRKNVLVSCRINDEDENFSDANKPYKIKGSLIMIIKRLDDELTKIFQHTIRPSPDFLQKLEGERQLCLLIEKIQGYVDAHRGANVFDVSEVTILYSIRIEHYYYKFFPNEKVAEDVVQKLCSHIKNYQAIRQDVIQNVVFPCIFNCVRHPPWYQPLVDDSDDSTSLDDRTASQSREKNTARIDGKDWSFIKQVYLTLASSFSVHVRHMVARSLHEVANMLDCDYVDNDLVPLFTAFMNDDAEIYYTMLQNLSSFFECASDPMRISLLQRLSQYLKVDGTRCWRLREEFADQCLKLCSLYNLGDINTGISCFALSFMDDKFDSVRQKGAILLARIVATYILAEWPGELVDADFEDLDIDVLLRQMSLTNGLLKDARRSFVNSINWRRRQTWALFLRHVLSYDHIKLTYFGRLFGENLKLLAMDSIANTRLKFLAIWKDLTRLERDGYRFDEACPSLAKQLVLIINNMINTDRDFQVQTEAKICRGLINPEVDELDYKDFFNRVDVHENEMWTRLENHREKLEAENKKALVARHVDSASTSASTLIENEEDKKMDVLTGMTSRFLPSLNFQSLWHTGRSSPQKTPLKKKFEGSKFVVSSVPENERSLPTYKPVAVVKKEIPTLKFSLADDDKSDSDDDSQVVEDDDVVLPPPKKVHSDPEVKEVVIHSPKFVVDAGIVEGLDIEEEPFVIPLPAPDTTFTQEHVENDSDDDEEVDVELDDLVAPQGVVVERDGQSVADGPKEPSNEAVKEEAKADSETLKEFDVQPLGDNDEVDVEMPEDDEIEQVADEKSEKKLESHQPVWLTVANNTLVQYGADDCVEDFETDRLDYSEAAALLAEDDAADAVDEMEKKEVVDKVDPEVYFPVWLTVKNTDAIHDDTHLKDEDDKLIFSEAHPLGDHDEVDTVDLPENKENSDTDKSAPDSGDEQEADAGKDEAAPMTQKDSKKKQVDADDNFIVEGLDVDESEA